MMKSEFIERTGFEPTEAEYREIEAEYMGCDIDKDEFCKAWKKQGGIQRLMRLRARRIEELEAELVKEKNDYDRMDAQYCTKINELKKQISDNGLALNSMNAQMGLMRNKPVETIGFIPKFLDLSISIGDSDADNATVIFLNVKLISADIARLNIVKHILTHLADAVIVNHFNSVSDMLHYLEEAFCLEVLLSV